MAIDAEEFYAQMEKPVPPNDRLLAQANLGPAPTVVS